MSYLEPPPHPAPVVVFKDVGGLVADYKDRTEQYRAQNREVRLHECRSACTLALSLPNVCVYQDSQLKFHQAYNASTKEVDYGISAELFRAYPPAIQARLQTLTRTYKVLRGSELIALGVRDCNRAPTIMVARAEPTQTQTSGSLSQTLGSLGSLFGAQPPTVPSPRPAPVAAPSFPEALPPISAPAITIPMPPRRPIMLARAEPQAIVAPPLAPYLFPIQRPIAGSAPILQPRFVSLSVLLRGQ